MPRKRRWYPRDPRVSVAHAPEERRRGRRANMVGHRVGWRRASDGNAALMSASAPPLPLTMATARDRIRERCFRPGPTGRVGLEFEWHVFDRAAPERIVPLDLLVDVTPSLGPLPHVSAVTFERGGQLELSSPPCAGV